MQNITYEEFEKVKILSGTIIKAEPFPRATKPAFKIWADFGTNIGVLQTSAQVTAHYTTESLIGMTIAGCVNLGERNIAGFMSQFLLLGFEDANGDISLITALKPVPNGQTMC